MYAAKKCTFCGKDVRLGTGVMLVRNDGSTQYYCSSKCRKNSLHLKRDPRKYKWTVFYKKAAKA
ncbi:MAG: 50S ribosomal protein L24e [Thaumarchaeota archaeon]|nr:50S ribosomal protein L24e [Nitrososphaerota archaeon]